ncbi:Precorrin-6A reductase [Slackia heliotrinireducens]|uniref:Precorrin-6x reductase n=1 Tax=Slackia heliotrinireducens (strain ATCC 29202 / DSM 20476 / NCTC 11029 / RHS 1) TaxID=471855 RepID=C7N896_SLAHD|nr:precorrin-6A reductase [Slackia heliotrinireducens]ACV23131.1 precorrin-6x reductase [Slackia heliotrinireducens DSM 20476]VEH02156.1 Precorrin-6A reductase [Slackia heliotrinireducens]
MMQPASNDSRPTVLVYGGTTESRTLVEGLLATGMCRVVLCVATEYGAAVMPPHKDLACLVGRQQADDMELLMGRESFLCVVDATHPYATDVTANIAQAAGAVGLSLIRVTRAEDADDVWLTAQTVEEAARIANDLAGNILLTTGTKDLPVFANAIDGFAERVYARILPARESLDLALSAGLAPSHIIAMQGPFSMRLNMALIEEFGISVMVTKASGRQGGFQEKSDAAKEAGCTLVVIARPVEEEGLSVHKAVAQVIGMLRKRGANHAG